MHIKQLITIDEIDLEKQTLILKQITDTGKIGEKLEKLKLTIPLSTLGIYKPPGAYVTKHEDDDSLSLDCSLLRFPDHEYIERTHILLKKDETLIVSTGQLIRTLVDPQPKLLQYYGSTTFFINFKTGLIVKIKNNK